MTIKMNPDDFKKELSRIIDSTFIVKPNDKKDIINNVFNLLNNDKSFTLYENDFDRDEIQSALKTACIASTKKNTALNIGLLFRALLSHLDKDLTNEEKQDIKDQLKLMLNKMLKANPDGTVKTDEEIEKDLDKLAEFLTENLENEEYRDLTAMLFTVDDMDEQQLRNLFGAAHAGEEVTITNQPIGNPQGFVPTTFEGNAPIVESFQPEANAVDPMGIKLANVLKAICNDETANIPRALKKEGIHIPHHIRPESGIQE